MKLSLTIRIDSINDAVVEDPVGELVQACERVARRLTDGDREGNVLDTNGNSVGTFIAKLPRRS